MSLVITADDQDVLFCPQIERRATALLRPRELFALLSKGRKALAPMARH